MTTALFKNHGNSIRNHFLYEIIFYILYQREQCQACRNIIKVVAVPVKYHYP